MSANWDDVALSVSHAAAQGEPLGVGDLLDFAEHVLKGSRHIDADHDHRADAEALLHHALGDARWQPTDRPPKRVRDRYLALIARRAGGEPVAQLTGRTSFAGLELRVRHGAFVPRSSSENTVKHVTSRLADLGSPLIVDLCTGVGPIALGLAHRLPHAQVWGTDISGLACAQARRNARRLQLPNVRFRKGSAYDPLPKKLQGRLDAVVGYIPYLSNDDIRGLHAEIGSYEPLHTLTDLSDDGFDLVRHVVSGAPTWLRPGGLLLIQIDAETATKLHSLFKDAGLTQVQTTEREGVWDVLVEGRTPM